ncbi:MAG TPA: thioredoxin domain-containing protein [Candidatus Limnocylindrales bacterium]|nr:thioredoxin domain-containing protein [Candidatus Limnocylindrales bacterium]
MKAGKFSLLSTLMALICCFGPIALLAIGLGSAGLTVGLLKYKRVFLSLGLTALAFSYYLYFREKTRCTTQGCQMVNTRFNKALLIFSTLTVLTFVVFSYLPYSHANHPSSDQAALVAAASTPQVLYFWEPCPTCAVLNPLVESLEKTYQGKVRFRWVNMITDDDSLRLARQENLKAIPYLVFKSADGQPVDYIVGFFTYETAKEKIENLLKNRKQDQRG